MNPFSRYLFILLMLFCLQPAFAQMPRILPLKQQGEVRDRWLKERFEIVLPDIMRREGVDMWVLISREYNEDPVLKTMLPSFWLSARRTTMLVIYDNGEELETLACARYDVGEVFKKAWDKEQQPDQWQRLVEIITERHPQKSAVNRSEHVGLADGISSYHYDKLMGILPAAYRDRVVSAERLAIGWLETRTPAEMAVYQQIVRIAHQIIAEGFSDEVIQPGVTTTDEVVWWYRERIRELLARRSQTQPMGEFSCGSVFRNPPGDHAARLIEACGLKGRRIGGARVSDKHANFIINAGAATAADIERLIEVVAAEVEQKHGVRLHPEVRIIGVTA